MGLGLCTTGTSRIQTMAGGDDSEDPQTPDLEAIS